MLVWYGDQEPGLGDRLADEFAEGIQFIREWPDASALSDSQYEDDELVVLDVGDHPVLANADAALALAARELDVIE